MEKWKLGLYRDYVQLCRDNGKKMETTKGHIGLHRDDI